ncbi:hypothetical protein [Bradyrhizobium sp. dw_411]|uniref:hypothetical protein n=1 Tax=Bradyrhizobium sp. dw_411 TaxID=2720082 RepID=UPI001BCE10BE|nr:hypothetical protein [Bradyrhizobium sp. dw_411]
MRSFWATPANPGYRTSIHPALTSFADECAGMLARLVAYVGALALLAIVGLHLWDELPAAATTEPAPKPGWSLASRSHPAFAVNPLDNQYKTEAYEIFRHPEGGRRDVLRWTTQETAQYEKPVAELEIYRPGGEFSPSDAPGAEIAARMEGDYQGMQGSEAAGVIDSKFGPVALLRLDGNADGAKSCLGFIKRLGDPLLQISGWTCQGDGIPARRAAIGCMLNRLILLTAGNEPKLAELFARAELKRGNCSAASPSAPSADWVTGTGNPLLRGPL